MKKICKYCNLEYDESDMVCCECGRSLEMTDEDGRQATVLQNRMPLGTDINQDNRIHKGDNISVGGDSVHAQNVDNRTVTSNTTTNTTNTTNNNYYQTIVDESKELVKCEISGKRILKVDSYECPVCKRTVASEYYVKGKRMCVECVEAAYGKETRVTTGLKAMAPLMVPTVEPKQPVFAPIKKKGGRNNKLYIVIGLVVAMIAVVVILLLPDKKESAQALQPTSQDTIVTRSSQGIVQKSASQSKSDAGKSSQGVVDSASQELIEGEQAAKMEKPAVVEEKKNSLIDRGIEAFNTKNYATAAVLLEQAAASGETQAGYYLSCLYRDGAGVKRDVKKAFSYMKQAAEGGCAKAYYDLGEMYRLGKGTEVNQSQAKKWYERAVVESAPNADKAAKYLNRYR